MIRDDQKLQVQQQTDLVRLIGESVALRPRGREFIGLCPFHDDKHPSMYVSPAKQIYKCFSCGAGGDAFAFVMQYHKMTFPEALRMLADRAGIKLEESRSPQRDGETTSDRQRILAANAQAVSFFQALYRHAEHGAAARAYVARRGISPEMIDAFALGYAPDRWDGLVTMVRDRRWDVRGFEQAGLITARQSGSGSRVPDSANEEGRAAAGSDSDGTRHPDPGTRSPSAGHYDRLRHRLIFPIFDALGRPIAFGGRKLREEDEPKYLNSPETAVFNKSATLYGLHRAKKPIIDAKTAVIVEGYTDVIACHQAGVCNVVATLGTALTPQHAAELRRYCDKVILVFDADAAGQKAADRATEVFLTGDLDVAIAVLPSPTGEKVDPAELFAHEEGPELWAAAMKQARDALDYQFDRMRSQLEGADTITGRQKLAEQYLQKLATLGAEKLSTLRGAMVRAKVADLLHLPEGDVAKLLHRLAPRRPRVEPTTAAAPATAAPAPGPASTVLPYDDDAPPPPSDADYPGEALEWVEPPETAEVSRARMKALEQVELELLGCLVRQPGAFEDSLPDGRTLDEGLAVGDLVTPLGRSLYQRMLDTVAAGEELSLPRLLAALAEENQVALSNLATTAALRVTELGLDEDDAAARRRVTEAAAALLERRWQGEQDAARLRLKEAVRDASDEGQQHDALRRLVEQARQRSSPVRIARLASP